MSRTETRTPVLSELQREVIECELRRAIEQRLSVSGDPTFDSALTARPIEAMGGIDDMIRHLAAVDVESPSGRATLAAGVAAIRAEAEAVGLDVGTLPDLEARLIDASAADRAAMATASHADVTCSLIDELSTAANAILEQRVEREVGERVRAAATVALQRSGLSDIELDDVDDGVYTLSAVGAAGENAHLVVTSSAVEIAVDDVGDAVGPLDPRAGDVCERAEVLADQVRERLVESLSEVGLAAGDVEMVAPPARGAQPGGFAARLSRHRGSTGAARSRS